MKIPINVNGKIYKVSFFTYLAYQNQKQLDRIEKKIDKLLSESRDQSTDQASDDGEA